MLTDLCSVLALSKLQHEIFYGMIMKVHMMIVRNRPGDKQQLSRVTFQFSDTTLRIKMLGGCVQETRNRFSAMHMSIDQCQEQNNEVVKGLGGAVETTHTNGWLSLKVAHSGQLLLQSSTRSS